MSSSLEGALEAASLNSLLDLLSLSIKSALSSVEKDSNSLESLKESLVSLGIGMDSMEKICSGGLKKTPLSEELNSAHVRILEMKSDIKDALTP